VVHFLGVAAVFVCWPLFVFILGGWSFLGGRERSSLMVVHWHRHGGRAVIGRRWRRRWCGGSGGGGGGWRKETMSHGVWLVVCLVTGVKQTNKQTTGFCCIPFLQILRNIPVSIPECPNSTGIKGTRMKKNSRPSCQILFHQILLE